MPLRRKKTDFGIVKIHNKVICSVASIAAGEVKGVGGMFSSPIKGFSSLFKKESYGKGVKLEFGDNNDVNVSIYIVVEYGANVPYVSTLVQESVKKRIEELTGLTVNEVEVNVYDVAKK